MNFIINHVYYLGAAGVCLIAIWLLMNATRDKPANQSVQINQSKQRQQEPEVEEVEEYTIVFTYHDGSTKKYTCEEVEVGEGYFELSTYRTIVAYIPFNQVKHAEFE